MLLYTFWANTPKKETESPDLISGRDFLHFFGTIDNLYKPDCKPFANSV